MAQASEHIAVRCGDKGCGHRLLFVVTAPFTLEIRCDRCKSLRTFRWGSDGRPYSVTNKDQRT